MTCSLSDIYDNVYMFGNNLIVIMSWSLCIKVALKIFKTNLVYKNHKVLIDIYDMYSI